MSLSAGTKLGPYEILSPIGAGGMGEVYLARDSRLDRNIVLKLLPEKFTRDPDRLRRFVQEARAASALNHPNIITIHEIGQESGIHFIAAEFVDGQTLSQGMTGRRFQLQEALDVAIQVAAALAAAHEAGIIHRDIKPENIMLRRDGIVKVLDFGIAKLTEKTAPSLETSAPTSLQARTEPGVVMGTAQYMSPEQARGQEVDTRSDIFSFGTVLYEMISGSPAFEGATASDLIAAILKTEPPPLVQGSPEAPRELEHIVGKTLRKDREVRYQTVKDLLIDLKDVRQELQFQVKLKSSRLSEESEQVKVSGRRAPAEAPSRRLSAAQSDQEAAAPLPSREEFVAGRKARRGSGMLITLGVLVVAGLSYAVYRLVRPATPVVSHFQNMKITRVTTEGNVESVAVSPDGKYIAYSLNEGGNRSLWTKHLGTGSRVQIGAPVEAYAINTSTFSRDGGYVYYTKVDEQNPQGALYQVPVLGGVSKKILSNVSQPVSLSPDGKQIAFGRYHNQTTEDILLVANADGTNERQLITIQEPQWLSGAGAAWSPDGKLLAVGYGNEVRPESAAQNLGMTVAVVSITDGKLREAASRRWLYVGNVAWFADGSGLAMVARDTVLGPLQIWQVPYPKGEARHITNDLSSYATYSLTLASNSGALVSVQSDPVSNLWTAPEGDATRARAITSGKNIQEGYYGLAWTPDGKLVYDSNVNSIASIWMVNSDGTNPKPLTESTADDFAPEVSSDGRIVVFCSGRTRLYQLWRMDIDGGNPKQLTEGNGVPTFSISPDGRWVICHPFVGGIYKVPIDGGNPIDLPAKGNLRYPQVSPDGKLLAYLFNDEKTKHPKLAVVKFDTGDLVRMFDMPVTSGAGLYESGFSLLNRGFHWSHDGRALVYINTLGEVSNIWSQPLDNGAPRQITDFKSDRIHNFAYSRDGRLLALSRGSQSANAVLISEIR